jgi:PAT family beta-lactamase induction signal transducer AmpG
MSATTPEKKKLSWKDVAKSLAKPKVAVMLALGFSSGLPFMLVGNTLGFWLREGGITLTTIGFLSWVGLAYSFKFLWAPLIDKVRVPIIGKMLGLRRGWLAFSQILVIIGLFGMAYFKPEGGIAIFTALAALAAFASSTQDIVVDAWRIEVSDSGDEMALLSSAYQLGYRGAMLLTDALILILAAQIGWPTSYLAMAATMVIGLTATFFAIEPTRTVVKSATPLSGFNLQGIYDAIAGPFIVFFKQHGTKALLMLAAVSLYRLADFFMGPMANPFYKDLGISPETVGAVRASVGLIASIAGVAAGGISALRLGLTKTLLIGAIIGPASNLAFSAMALMGPTNEVFAAAMAIDNFSGAFAGTALVGYMSSLTSVGYIATQYALLSSFYTLFGKTLKGFSGLLVDSLSVGRELMQAYAIFFGITALIGLPALILCIVLVGQKSSAPKQV